MDDVNDKTIYEKKIREIYHIDYEFFAASEIFDDGGLRFIRSYIGWLEIIFFAALTFVLCKYGNLTNIVDGYKIVGVSASAWITLKIFGNYQQWGTPIVGRVLFYIFLIGTIMNISAAVALGYASSLLLP
jgi:hypothetical protein